MRSDCTFSCIVIVVTGTRRLILVIYLSCVFSKNISNNFFQCYLICIIVLINNCLKLISEINFNSRTIII